MAHDYQLKSIVLGLENWAIDCVKLGNFLNLRAAAIGTRPFSETAFVAPTMPLPSPTASLKKAADLLDHVVDRNDDTVIFLRGTPTTTSKPIPPVVKTVPTREENIRLIIHWLSATSGFFKSILRLYGEEPHPHPPAPHPGPKTETYLLAEAAAWIEKIGKDADSFAAAQKIQHDPSRHHYDTAVEGGEIDASLTRIELGLHKIAQDVGAIGSVLPYHLLRNVQ